MLQLTRSWWPLAAAIVIWPALPAVAQPLDLQDVARNLVQAAMVKTGDKVLITGSVRDATLMEHIAIETRKVGGQCLIALQSEQLARRYYDEVPAMYDTLTPTYDLALTSTTDVQIGIDVGESEGLLSGVPPERREALTKAYEPVTQAFLQRNTRSVFFGNSLYPTAVLARRLGVPQSKLAAAFWRAVSVPAEALRSRGEAARSLFARSSEVLVTHPNGTRLTFRVDAARAVVSDGALTPEKVKQGGGAALTYLPAGELMLPAVAGTAEGQVVIDKVLWDGEEVRGLALAFSKGRLTAMTAASGLGALKARYDAAAAGGGKDQFGCIDIGLNPELQLPVGTGASVWSAPGAVSLALGDNRTCGGTNASDFGLWPQLGGATVKAGEAIVVENGVLK